MRKHNTRKGDKSRFFESTSESTPVSELEVIFYSILESVSRDNKLVMSNIEYTIEYVKYFPGINKMNSNSAFFDVSSFEYVDPNDEILIDLKRLIEKDEIEPAQKVVDDTLTNNLGIEEDPKRSKLVQHLIKRK